MNHTHLTAAMLAILSSPLASQSLVHRDVPATHMRELTVTVNYLQTTTLATSDLSTGCDTVLHLLDGLAEVARNDDAPGGGPASSITFTNLNLLQTSFTLLVRPFETDSTGTADVTQDGNTLLNNAFVGGAVIDVPGGFPVPWVYETAMAPNGARNVRMYAIDNWGQVFARDEDGGVGLNARIAATGVTKILVGTSFPGSMTGPVHFYCNDVWLGDADLDGLGNQLESALGTCDGMGVFGIDNGNCSQVFNSRDTDHDGLVDGHEIFGIDDPNEPQHLARWGADPLHKDVFVEVDWVADDLDDSPLTAAEIQRVQQQLALAPAADVNNPDGMDGISLHVDVFFQSPPTANPELATLFGDWGGSNASDLSYTTAPETFRHPVRAGIFRYALATDGGGGQGRRPGDRFKFGGSAGVFAHELGHTMGLSHAGHASCGNANAKPNYMSLMNYGYESNLAMGYSFGRDPGFPMSPAEVSESIGIGLAFDAQLTNWFRNYRRPIVPTYGIDWDFNGSLQRPIRAALTFLVRGTGGEALGKNSQLLATDLASSTTPVILRAFGDRLFALFAGRDGRLYMTWAETSGPDSNGSCPGGGDLGDPCCDWQPLQVVNLDQEARAVTASVYEKRLVVAYRTKDSRVRVRSAKDFYAGQLQDWSQESEVKGATCLREPHLSPMWVDPENFDGSETALGLFCLSDDKVYRWFTTTSATGSFDLQKSEFPDDDQDGKPLVGKQGPVFTTWPHFDPQHTGPRHTVGVLIDEADGVRSFTYDKAGNRWVDKSTGFFRNRPTCNHKPGLAFHVMRHRQGVPLDVSAEGVPKGQLWLTTANASGKRERVARMWVSSLVREVNGEMDLDWHDNREGWYWNMWSKNLAGTGITLYEDLRLSALKGLRLQNKTHNKNTPFQHTTEELRFQPFADGTFGARLDDCNDWRVMERGIGVGIAGEAFCGTAAQSTWGF